MDLSGDEKLVKDFFDCLESNLTIAGAFTSKYDGPLSREVQTVLNTAGDVTILLHDFGAFRGALLIAMDAEPTVGLAVRAINFGCSLIDGDEPPETPEPGETPAPTPDPTDTTRKEKLVEDLFDCLERNLAVAGAFTDTYDGPLSGEVHTVLDATGDITSLMHDFGLFEAALVAAMDANPLVAPAVLAINFGCSFISIDEPQQTPEPTPKQPADSGSTKCQELALKIIEQSQEEDTAEDRILEITGVAEIADGVLGLQCKGLSHTQSSTANWIEFHENRFGRYRYEPLKLRDYECEYLVPQVIQMSQSRERIILEIHNIEEVERNNDELTCLGTAETSTGEYEIEFYAEESDDEPAFGYDLTSSQ